MTKKEYVIKLLTSIKETRLPAEGLLLLIEREELDNGLIDTLSVVFQNAVQKMRQEQTMNKLTQSLEVLEKIKRLEGEQKESDAELDALLANI